MIYTQEGHVSLAPGALEEAGRGELKKKKEKGTERGKGCVCVIYRVINIAAFCLHGHVC